MRKINHPPRIGTWILKRIYDEGLFEEVSGDLYELYFLRLGSMGKRKASLFYLWDVILSIRNIDLKKKSLKQNNEFAMLGNIITISFRSLRNRKFYSILNLAGLTTSICFSLLLWLYVSDQHSYDKHYENALRIYRVNADFNMNGKRDIYCNVPQPVAAALKKDFAEVEETVRMAGLGGLEVHTAMLKVQDRKIKSSQLFIVGPTFFKIFNHEFADGSSIIALSEPNSIVITEKFAIKLFGTTHALGMEVSLPDYGKLLKVTGVLKDESANTHLTAEAFVSWDTFKEWDLNWWYGGHVYTYLLLKDGNDINRLQAKMPAFFNNHMKKTFDEFSGKGELAFQPLTDIYLGPEYVWEAYPHGSKTNVFALQVVMIFLLIFACVNYVNLATAFAAERATEVGIRKMLGSSRKFLLIQFLSESILLAVFSGFMALMLSWILLPYFSGLAGLHINSQRLFSLENIGIVVALSFCIGIVAGVFPAFYLASINSLNVLKGKFMNSEKGEIVRRILVSGQYFITALLLTGVLIVAHQTKFIMNKDLGFNKSNLVELSIPKDSVVQQHLDVFKQELRKSGNVLETSLTDFSMNKEANSFSPTLKNPDGTTFQMGCDVAWIDAVFLKTIDAKIIIGRNFIDGSEADEDGAIMINETAMKKFGWKDNVLLGEMSAFTPREPVKFKVVGVIKDFSLGASYQLVHPMIFFFRGNRDGSSLYARIDNSQQASTAINNIQVAWEKIFPRQPMEYKFVDDSLNAIYEKEQRFLSLLINFSVIIIGIAALGIIGLISFTVQRKKKEIAIRKVLGSSVRGIITLLSGRFAKMLVISNILAAPVSYYLVSKWLNNFAYRIDITLWPFVFAFTVCGLLTAISVFYHTSIAASANPVDSLKCE